MSLIDHSLLPDAAHDQRAPLSTGVSRNDFWAFGNRNAKLPTQAIPQIGAIHPQAKCCSTFCLPNDPGGPTWASRDQIWLRGPRKGHFGPKRALLEPPGAQKEPDTKSKCVVTMSPTQESQSGAVGTKSGPPGPSEDLQSPQKGHSAPNEPFWGPQEQAPTSSGFSTSSRVG